MGLLERLKEGGECDGTAGVIKGGRGSVMGLLE